MSETMTRRSALRTIGGTVAALALVGSLPTVPAADDVADVDGADVDPEVAALIAADPFVAQATTPEQLGAVAQVAARMTETHHRGWEAYPDPADTPLRMRLYGYGLEEIIDDLEQEHGEEQGRLIFRDGTRCWLWSATIARRLNGGEAEPVTSADRVSAGRWGTAGPFPPVPGPAEHL